MIATLRASLGAHTNTELNEDMLRHMILNVIRSNRQKFSRKHGELVIACDDRNTWRRDFFPHYKANRKKSRDEDELDWNLIFDSLDKIREELREYFPYPTIHAPGAEADDVISWLVHEFSWQPVTHLILSGDHDFIQLKLVDPTLKQYNPVLKKEMTSDDPRREKFEHVVKGDSGDGIPNILMPDDFFVTKKDGERQKPISKKMVDEWMADLTTMSPEQRARYNQNQMLIDLNFVPPMVLDDIQDEWRAQQGKDRSKLFNYMISHRLSRLTESINDF